MITYDQFWLTLAKKGISQNQLIRDYHVSKGQLDRLRKNQIITTYTINRLCNILECKPDDILTYTPDSNT